MLNSLFFSVVLGRSRGDKKHTLARVPKKFLIIDVFVGDFLSPPCIKGVAWRYGAARSHGGILTFYLKFEVSGA